MPLQDLPAFMPAFLFPLCLIAVLCYITCLLPFTQNTACCMPRYLPFTTPPLLLHLCPIKSGGEEKSCYLLSPHAKPQHLSLWDSHLLSSFLSLGYMGFCLVVVTLQNIVPRCLVALPSSTHTLPLILILRAV